LRWRTKWTAIAVEFILLFVFWIFLSGRTQLKYLIIGLFAAGLVTFLTNDYIYNSNRGADKDLGTRFVLLSGLRWIKYMPWLVWAIIKANIQVAVIILKRQLPIDPTMLQFKTTLKKKASLVTLANSITLTPGTITVLLENNTYIIHSLVRECAGDIETAVMQNKAGEIFEDNPDPAPTCTWAYTTKELKQ
jgi:multicomponent Na+:H+ antiporter subunit E